MKTYIKPRITDICLENDSTAEMQSTGVSIPMAMRASGPDACGVPAGSAEAALSAFGGAGVMSCIATEGLIFPSAAAESAAAAAAGGVLDPADVLKGFSFTPTYNCP